MRFVFRAEVRVKAGVADPAGLAIERSLPALGFAGVSEVAVGKAIRFAVDAPGEAAASALAEELCERLLANPVLERYELELLHADEALADSPADRASGTARGSGEAR